MTFTPFYDKILIEPLPEDGVLERSDNNFQEAGLVIEVGAGVRNIAPGDTVFFHSYGAAKTAKIDGNEYWVVTATSEFILGVIKKDAPPSDVSG